MKLRLAFVVAFATLGLTACGSSEITPDAEYESVEELRDAYRQSGVSDEKCEDPSKDTVEDWGSESVNCGAHTVLVVYRTAEAKELDESRGYNGVKYLDSDSSIVTGPNWYIRTRTWNAESVKEVFGGKVEQGTMEK